MSADVDRSDPDVYDPFAEPDEIPPGFGDRETAARMRAILTQARDETRAVLGRTS